jgi:hypothetical protein
MMGRGFGIEVNEGTGLLDGFKWKSTVQRLLPSKGDSFKFGICGANADTCRLG